MFGPKFKMIPILALVPGMLLGAPIKIIESDVPIREAYAPAGFDSNDNSEIIVSGFLPNLCYKSPRSHVEIKGNKINIGIQALKNVGGLSFCADVIVPFVEIVDIGLLAAGKYDLAINENSPSGQKININIAEANSNSIDDAIYANVSSIVPQIGNRKVLLKGYNPSDCFEFDKIEILDNGSNVYSILPKLKQIRQFCPQKMVEFSYEFIVPEKLIADRVLLHVRIMDGKSLNALYNNKEIAEE